METPDVYTVCKVPGQLFPLLTELAEALGIGTAAALVHLAIYGAGGDAIGSGDMGLYERLRAMDETHLSMAQRERTLGAEIDEIPF